MRKLAWALPSLIIAVPAQAETGKLSARGEYTDFTNGYGNRAVGTVEFLKDSGETSVILSGSYGRREYGAEEFKAARVSATLYHDWNERFYTRTKVAVATGDPVFATRELAQEINFKARPSTILSAGGQYRRYFGDVDAIAWTLGATQYFRGGFISYRYTGYDVEHVGNTHGHLASVRLDDRRGSGNTQLWLGIGTSLHEQQFLPMVSKGDVRSVSVRRVQPISKNLALDLGLAQSWYDTGPAKYQGTSVRVGISLLQ